MLGDQKYYFADVYKAIQCYFEHILNIKFVAISQFGFCDLEDGFPNNRQVDKFCVRKITFANLDEKIEWRLFEQ